MFHWISLHDQSFFRAFKYGRDYIALINIAEQLENVRSGLLLSEVSLFTRTDLDVPGLRLCTPVVMETYSLLRIGRSLCLQMMAEWLTEVIVRC